MNDREAKRYLTDDCDQNDMELRLFQGDNGDWYLSIASRSAEPRFTRHCVRVTTSGNRLPGMPTAVFNLFEAMNGGRKPSTTYAEWMAAKATAFVRLAHLYAGRGHGPLDCEVRADVAAAQETFCTLGPCPWVSAP